MDKKTFYIICTAIVLTFVFTLLLLYARPDTAGVVSLDDFPLEIGEWQGEKQFISDATMELLNPQAIISAVYTNKEGVSVHLLFDFFSSEAAFGGPHAPRNCLPGSGWVISETESAKINIESKEIDAGRFLLTRNRNSQVMEFWYITHLGETANDYVFKLYELGSALLFKPRDVAFVRFVCANDAESVQALREFQKLVLPVIYDRLPF
ncbi:MAG: EpsI family protein [Calditrichaeota bacterium]|nr:MAG: EpsI family protein [Calditrichota bacterium]